MDVVYRPLVFGDLWESRLPNVPQIKVSQVLIASLFPKGFVGILFREICENQDGWFYTQGAFVEEKLVGFVVGINEYAKVRQLTEFEHGLTAVTGKKLAHIPMIVVDEAVQRTRIGATLLSKFLETIPDAAAFVYLPHKNVSAQHFFEASGFRVNCTLRKYYDEFEDALVFVKSSD